MADQNETPYLDAVVGYVSRNPGRFHIPGHKGTGADPGLVEALGKAAILHDVPAGIEGIDVMSSISRAERSQITLRFRIDRNPDGAAADVRDRVSRARSRLPDAVDEPVEV